MGAVVVVGGWNMLDMERDVLRKHRGSDGGENVGGEVKGWIESR